MPENEKQLPQSPWIKSPNGVFETYANNIHIMWSKDDLRVRLAQMVESPETPNPGADFRAATEERAAVTFSWRGAKLLRDQLTKVIEAYEKVNGEIKVDVVLPTSF
jgi:hypothetical protein